MNSADFGIKDLPKYLSLVDEKLKSLASIDIRGVDRLLQAGGKRWRPSLIIAIAFHSGKDVGNKVIDAAAAIELVHLASLVHDDIIDEGTLRHGVPTISSKEGVDSAILAGDYLFAKGCALASGVSAEAGQTMAETIAYLCNGQAMELADDFNVNRTTESLIAAIKGKTSSMFVASCTLGGIVAGLADKDIDALSSYGDNFGIAYQYMDDVKDFVESPETSGKSVGNDVREGKYTLPVILSLQGSSKPKLVKLLQKENVSTLQVLEIIKADGSIDQVIKEAAVYKRKALQALQKIDNPQLVQTLRSLVEKI